MDKKENNYNMETNKNEIEELVKDLQNYCGNTRNHEFKMRDLLRNLKSILNKFDTGFKFVRGEIDIHNEPPYSENYMDGADYVEDFNAYTEFLNDEFDKVRDSLKDIIGSLKGISVSDRLDFLELQTAILTLRS